MCGPWVSWVVSTLAKIPSVWISPNPNLLSRAKATPKLCMPLPSVRMGVNTTWCWYLAKDSPINRGNYSTGGTNALTVWSLDRGTQDRLTYPLLRVGDQFQAITWQDALSLIVLREFETGTGTMITSPSSASTMVAPVKEL